MTFLWVMLGAGAALILLGCVSCGALAWWAGSAPTASPESRRAFDLATVPAPYFPERGIATPVEPGVDSYDIILGPQGGYYSTPGHGGALRLYLPSGAHAPQSLPCVIIAGAGTTLLTGVGLGDSAEHLPYVRAGIAVVAYELDGPERGQGDSEMKAAYEAFKNSRAGMVNARNAIDFVITRVPEVDPRRIYSAGHSSAGTASLLAAAHDQRLAGCIAFAPCLDVAKHLTPAGMRMMSLILLGLPDFAVQSSPVTHRERLHRPVYLFHAEDDSVCDVNDSRDFADRLRARGVSVTFDTVPFGDHYEPMISDGIPRAIEWIHRQPR
jgi:acetyl esterase/lipase